MSQPINLSDELVLNATVVGAANARSAARQIEHWADLGKAIESLLDGSRVLGLRQLGEKNTLAHLLSTVDSPEGRQRVQDYLAGTPYPHYEAADSPGLLVRIDADGSRTIGRFVNRQFQAAQ